MLLSDKDSCSEDSAVSCAWEQTS